MKTILLIDDDEDYREVVRLVLEGEGIEVLEADSPDSAFKLLEKSCVPDLIVCDLHMPFTTDDSRDDYMESSEVGIRAVHELAWVYPSTPVVAMTSMPKIDLQRIRESVDPVPAFTKPMCKNDLAELFCTILVSADHGGIN